MPWLSGGETGDKNKQQPPWLRAAHRPNPQHRMHETKTCWICFESASNNTCSISSGGDDDWIEPCKCIGSTRWVHHKCLSAWIDRQPAGESTEDSQEFTSSNTNNTSTFSAILASLRPEQHRPVCPQCRFSYFIAYERPRLLSAMEIGKSLYNRLLLASSLFGLASSVYFVSFSYGYAACSAVWGGEAFSRLISTRCMNAGQSGMQMKMLLGIPAVPWILVALAYNKTHVVYPFVPILMLTSTSGSESSLRLFQWPLAPQLIVSMLPLVQAAYQRLKQFTLQKVSAYLWNSGESEEGSPSLLSLNSPTVASSGYSRLQIDIQTDNATDSAIDEVVIVRHLKRIISALTLPFAASALGRLLFGRNVGQISAFHQALIGGAICTVGADLGSALMKYWWLKWRLSRRILNYPKLTEGKSMQMARD